MKIYSRYIFLQIFSAFGLILAVLCGLIWFSRAISLAEFASQSGVGVLKFLQLSLLILPSLLVFLIPIALVCAIIIVFNRLLINHEATILRSCGIDKFHIITPILLNALICLAFSYFITLFLMPYANQQIRHNKTEIFSNFANALILPQVFQEIQDVTIYVQDRKDDKLSGILIYQDKKNQSKLVITAKEGQIVNLDEQIWLNLHQGSIQQFENQENSNILYFEKYSFNLIDNNPITKHILKDRERYLHQLIIHDQIDEKTVAKFFSEFHERLVYPLFSVVLSLIVLFVMFKGDFNRFGNRKNIFKAVVICVIFIASNIAFFDLIEIKMHYYLLIYLNVVLFVSISLFSLRN